MSTNTTTLKERIDDGNLQVLLAHPGGPFFKNKDEGAWSIPKGEIEPDEDLLEAAQREFNEETGVKPTGPFVALTPVQQKGGKVVHAWAIEGDYDPTAIVSNTFTMEWPPKSGQQVEFPEMIDELVAAIPDARQGFRLLFSAARFPGYQRKLTRLREEFGGWWYSSDEPEAEGWLCPALFRYFDEVPEEIYVKAEAK